RVTESIRRYHRGGAVQGRFSPFETVRSYYARARHECVAFPGGLGLALALLERVEALLPRGTPIGPCHNDLLPANLIDDGRQIWIIDWEYAGLGDPFFDLGNLAANLELSEEQERALLETYSGEIRENDLRHLRLMRLASDMREALWGFLQSGISTLDFDFFAYGSQHLDRFLGAASYLDSLPDSRPPASQP
ncbi:MAG TPA: phosphotransferase, partial [Chloroflexota bacterium]|nr:phosphotransferase [Chloroflexota bacterium]